jgi:hypothetical protein
MKRSLMELPKKAVKLVLGDLNAHVGRTQHSLHAGPHSYHKKPDNNGERLVDFAAAHNLCISSTFSPRRRSDTQWGWDWRRKLTI